MLLMFMLDNPRVYERIDTISQWHCKAARSNLSASVFSSRSSRRSTRNSWQQLTSCLSADSPAELSPANKTRYQLFACAVPLLGLDANQAPTRSPASRPLSAAASIGHAWARMKSPPVMGSPAAAAEVVIEVHTRILQAGGASQTWKCDDGDGDDDCR